MKRYHLLSFLFITFWIALYSCKDETVEPTSNDQYRYFPLITGSWTEYSADSIIHLDIDDVWDLDTAIRLYHFFIREEIDTPFVDAEGDTAFIIKRYKRDSDTLPWSFQNVWTAKLDKVSGQRVEDNVRFLRMQFPIASSSLWNGNAYNFFPQEDYSYEDLFEQRTYNGLQFPSTVTVLQNDFVTQISKIFKEEVYAKDAGLVFKQLDSVRIKNLPTGTIIQRGLEYKLTVTNYKH